MHRLDPAIAITGGAHTSPLLQDIVQEKEKARSGRSSKQSGEEILICFRPVAIDSILT